MGRLSKRKKKKNTTLLLHPGQAEVFNNEARFKVLCCSRRWGKSRLLMTILITKAINFEGEFDPLSPSVCALIMPTLKQAKSIHWAALCAALDGHPAVDKINRSDHRIILKGNRPDIVLRGCNEDSGDSLRGSKFYFAAFDEIQDVKEIVWTEVVSPALADTAGSTAFFCGCVNPNTLVLTDTGFEKIGNLNPGAGTKQWKELNRNVWGLNKEFHLADGFWNNGLQQTLIITTDSGYSIEATHNHPVYTDKGWVKLEDLNYNSKVAIDFGMDVWGKKIPGELLEMGYISPELAPTAPLKFSGELSYMLGYMVQKAHWIYDKQGNCTGFRFNPKNEDDRKHLLKRTMFGYRFRQSKKSEWHGRPLIMESPVVVKWLKGIGMDFENPIHHREVPLWVFTTTKGFVTMFLKGVYDSCGAPLRKKGKSVRRINLYSRSKVFSQQIQTILLNYGIVSRLTESVNRDKRSKDPNISNKKYLLAVRGEYFNTFKKYIGFKRAEFLREFERLRYSREGARFKVEGDYFYDKVVSIKQSACQTVDFTVPDTNSYIGNGIMCHNTPKGIGTFFHDLYQNEKNPEMKGWKSFHQTVYDNPFIPRDEIDGFKAALPPKAFEQEFMASWVSFDGQIYSDLSTANLVRDEAVPTDFDEVILGIDWGDINPALVVVGYKKGVYFLIDYWENENSKYAIEQRLHDEAAVAFCEKYPITSAYADPSQPGRILSMRRAGIPRLVKGYNKVSEGNGIVNTLLYQKRLLIQESKCRRPFEVMTAYHRKKKDGIIFDEPALHQDDHIADALRYVIASREHKNFAQENYGQRLILPKSQNLVIPQKQGLYV